MPNSQDIAQYPVLLFDAFAKAADQDPVAITTANPTAAKNLRSLCYTFRKLLAASPEDWHQQLFNAVARKKFYIDGSRLLISSPMMLAQRHATIEDNTP